METTTEDYAWHSRPSVPMVPKIASCRPDTYPAALQLDLITFDSASFTQL
jgi:hypothetical protein